MKPKARTKTVRGSVALSRQLVEDVTAVAPPELRQNLNRLVSVALREFAAQQKARAFDEAMARMGADPPIRAECGAISRAFARTEADGLERAARSQMAAATARWRARQSRGVSKGSTTALASPTPATRRPSRPAGRARCTAPRGGGSPGRSAPGASCEW